MGVLRPTILLLLLVFIYIAHTHASSQETIDLLALSDGAVTDDKYRYLIDPSGNMTIESVRESFKWVRGEKGETVKGIMQGAVWMQLRLSNSADREQHIKLEHTESRVNKLTMIAVGSKSNHIIQVNQFDLFAPVAERPYPHHRPVFPITVPANETVDIFFKFEYLPNVRGAIYTEFKIWKSHAFEKAYVKEASLLTLFFAIHIIMGLITISIYVVNRDRVFLFYSFYAFATVGTRAATNGMLGFVVYTDGMEVSELTLPIAIYQMTIFIFAREFLQVERVAPNWDIVLKFIMACSLISIVLAFSGFAQYVGLVTEAITAAYPVVLITSLICWHKGVPNALLFAMGWTLLLAGGIITFAARDSGVVEHAPWSYWLAHTGAIIEVFLLAGLLVSRVVRMRREKAFVEHKYREHLKNYSWELKRKVEQQTIALKNAKENAEREARTDVLTGLTNRRYFMENSMLAIERAQLNSWNIWLVTVDIDHFKQVNDAYGHTAGDAALRAVAKVLASKIRNVDIVARIGGEEFALVIEGGKQQEALHVCERLRSSIEAVPIIHGEDVIPITISIGVAMQKPDESLDQLVSRSDKALYQAKEEGRNCVVEACN